DSDYRDVENEGGYDIGSNAVTEEEAGYGYSYENEHYNTEQNRGPINIHNLPAGNLCIIKPKCVDDVIFDVVKLLKDDCIIILNLTEIENGERTRIVDYVCGVVNALDGNIAVASPFTYTIAPKAIAVSSNDKPVEGVNNFMNGSNN
ncbi:MAG: cell division protein SepF, partial [Oscillospiraceae bacterium]